MFFMNAQQYFALDKRLKDLGFVTETVAVTKTIDYESQIPNPTLVTLFTEGKLEDPTSEFRQNLRKILTTNYETQILVPIIKKYETQMKHGIEAWIYEYNISRLNNILKDDDRDFSFNSQKNVINIPIIDTDGYSIKAEERGAEKAVKAYKDIGYNAYVNRSINGSLYICIVLKELPKF